MKNLYSELILDLNKNPKNYGILENYDHMFEGYNPLCGDNIIIYIKLSENIDTIDNISFTGSGCAISIAAASLLTEIVKKKSIDLAKKIISEFFNMINKKEYNSNLISKLLIFKGISDYPARVKCATMSFHTLNNNLRD